MNKDTNSENLEKFYEAVLTLEDKKQCKEFFEDICTITELNSISQRLHVAFLLKKGMTFNEIVSETGASTATISRVNRCLQYGSGGYNSVIG